MTRAIDPVATSIAAFVGRTRSGPVDEATSIASFADFDRVFGGLSQDSSVSFAVRDYFANGGSQAVVVRVDGDERRGLAALDRVDQFTLLCIPPPTLDGETATSVYRVALDYCVRRRAMLLIDPPPGLTSATARPHLDDLGSADSTARNAALYFPRLRAVDPTDGGRLRTFVPCGAVAGVMARTDAAAGVWKAPAGAGAAIADVEGPAVELSDAESGWLNSIGINCLRSFPSRGTLVWGARTLRGADALADEWKYVPVRRLALWIEESIDRGTQWAVFEPNDEPLWASTRQSVGDFLERLFRQGAFQGRTSREAYVVHCGRDTTSQRDIETGLIDIVVGFAPLRPAEFVLVRLQRRTALSG
jgi:hypothetical protein